MSLFDATFASDFYRYIPIAEQGAMRTGISNVGENAEVVESEQFEDELGGVEEILPLTPLQEGLLFHALYDGVTSDVYTVQLALGLEGELEGGELRKAGEALLRRHGNLRAGFIHEDLSEPVQVIWEKVGLPWREADLRGLGEAEQQRRWEELRSADEGEGFDVGAAPLLRMTLVRLGEQRYRLLLTNHHILLDGWSMPVLLRELFVIYAQRGSESGLGAVTPYREYLGWLQG